MCKLKISCLLPSTLYLFFIFELSTLHKMYQGNSTEAKPVSIVMRMTGCCCSSYPLIFLFLRKDTHRAEIQLSKSEFKPEFFLLPKKKKNDIHFTTISCPSAMIKLLSKAWLSDLNFEVGNPSHLHSFIAHSHHLLKILYTKKK
jgi:hypothetical protein